MTMITTTMKRMIIATMERIDVNDKNDDNGVDDDGDDIISDDV